MLIIRAIRCAESVPRTRNLATRIDTRMAKPQHFCSRNGDIALLCAEATRPALRRTGRIVLATVVHDVATRPRTLA
jgi:hypothetical protein